MPSDWVRYALVKAYLACLDERVPANVENVSLGFEARMPQMCDEITTNQVAAFIAEQRG